MSNGQEVWGRLRPPPGPGFNRSMCGLFQRREAVFRPDKSFYSWLIVNSPTVIEPPTAFPHVAVAQNLSADTVVTVA